MSGHFFVCIIIASVHVIPECILPILVLSYLHFESYSRVDSLKYDDCFTVSPHQSFATLRPYQPSPRAVHPCTAFSLVLLLSPQPFLLFVIFKLAATRLVARHAGPAFGAAWMRAPDISNTEN
ncbi:hypothetical protein SCLCIDRAFT_1132701 [Scleroderma citrinum Foug A]|uniref:Uncharacterized protein n=1 Tax=Scleroderma citrinum Foug A TaxID=1036808 RepID=A0A0C3DMU7_9AGAM|nr:hypothetical protein SCLCIDRAFT_1132701 [Scleroderma citrinum Foug A]